MHDGLPWSHAHVPAHPEPRPGRGPGRRTRSRASPSSPARPAPASRSWWMPCPSWWAPGATATWCARAPNGPWWRPVAEGGFEAWRAFLAERGLPEEQPVVLRREIAAGGRSRAWLNGGACSLADLREAGRIWMRLTSQHDHQSLMAEERHLGLLDEVLGIRPDLAREAAEVREAQARLAARKRSESQRGRAPGVAGGADRRPGQAGPPSRGMGSAARRSASPCATRCTWKQPSGRAPRRCARPCASWRTRTGPRPAPPPSSPRPRPRWTGPALGPAGTGGSPGPGPGPGHPLVPGGRGPHRGPGDPPGPVREAGPPPPLRARRARRPASRP